MSTRSSRKTPRVPAGKAQAVVAQTPSMGTSSIEDASPARVERVGEKNQMQELNHRLEFYILRQREKQAAQEVLERDLDVHKQRALADIEIARDSYKAEIDEIRDQRDGHAKRATELQQKSQRLNSQVAELTKKADEDKKFRDSLEKQVSSLSKDNQTKTAELLDVNNKFQDASKNHKLADGNVKSLRKDLDKAQQDTDKALGQLNELEASKNRADEDLAIEKRKNQAEKKRLTNEVDTLSKAQTATEDEIRKEFAEQLNEILAERQQQYEQEKNQLADELKSVYEEKVDAFREQNEMLAREKIKLDEERGMLQALLEKQQNKVKQADRQVATLTKTVNELKKQVAQEMNRPTQELEKKNSIIKNMKDAYRRKEVEFDALMDVKIQLAMEIKAYRLMLDQEEARMGYTSPATSSASAKKRKRSAVDEHQKLVQQLKQADASSSSSSSARKPRKRAKRSAATPANKAPTPEVSVADTLCISGMDLEGQYLNLRNASSEIVSLKGWKLTNQAKDKEFALPADIKLVAGQTITLWVGKAKQDKHDPKTGNIVWAEDVWTNEGGDEAVLLNPEGNVTSKVTVVPSDAAQQGSNQCTIM